MNLAKKAIYIWLFPFNPCPNGKVWLEVWFGGMIRGYDSRVWFAAPKTFISSTGRELSLETQLYRPSALPTELTWLWPPSADVIVVVVVVVVVVVGEVVVVVVVVAWCGVWFDGMVWGYDSGVWFEVWFGGMIRGYDSSMSNLSPY